MAGPAKAEMGGHQPSLNAQEIARMTGGRSFADYTGSDPFSQVTWPNGNDLLFRGAQPTRFRIPSADPEGPSVDIPLKGMIVEMSGSNAVFISSEPMRGFLITSGGVITEVLPEAEIEVRTIRT